MINLISEKPFNRVFKLRNGNYACIMPNRNSNNNLAITDFRDGEFNTCFYVENYNNNLAVNIKGYEYADIIAYTREYDYPASVLTDCINKRDLCWIWKEQDEPEEMTFEEVCKALGKTIKIVKSE
jgi:hypothetical protein